MKLENKILKALADYEKQIKGLVNTIHFCRTALVKAFIEERKKRRLSLRTAAKQLGVSAPYLSDIENSRRELSLNLLEKFKKF